MPIARGARFIMENEGTRWTINKNINTMNRAISKYTFVEVTYVKMLKIQIYNQSLNVSTKKSATFQP